MSEIVTIQVPVELDDEFFDNIICTMIEGGSNYWIDKISIHSPYEKKEKSALSERISDALNKGGYITILPKEWDYKECTINKLNIVNGLKMWIENHPDSVTLVSEDGRNCIDAGNIDADDADAILQYSTFGDIIFG